MRFLAAYNGAWCMPSRSTMLTGRHSFGIESMRIPGCEYDPKKVEFWPKNFCQKGYFTAQIGKLHTGTDRLQKASVEGLLPIVECDKNQIRDFTEGSKTRLHEN